MDSDRSDDQPAANQSEDPTPPDSAQHSQSAPWERGAQAGTEQFPAGDPWQQGYAQPGYAPNPTPQHSTPQHSMAVNQMAANQMAPSPMAPQFAAAPAQMWLPPGQYLQPSTWRKRWKTPVIVGSAIVGTLMAAVTVFALTVGSAVSSVFTARGAVVVDCQTRATFQQSIHAGSTVQIWSETGALESSAQLEGMKTADSQSGTQVCFLPFAATKVPSTQAGFNVRIGGYSQFVTAGALKSGVVIRPR